MQKKNSTKCYIWLLLFVIIAILCWLFPYTGDDWAWGSSIGIDRWNIKFRNYSGRYLGNMIVLVLTRSRILRALVISLCIVGITYLIVKISECGRCTMFLVVALLLACPKEMLRESIVWTSGFSNYVTSITLFLVYMYLVRQLFSDKAVVDKKKYIVQSIFLLVLGCASAMIVEHVTIMQIVLGGGIAIYAWIKEKKIDYRCLAYFAGSVFGAVMMFSNECYSSAVSGTDGYRSVATSITEFLNSIQDNYFNIIGQQMMLNNIVLEIFAAAVLTILFINKYHEYKEKLHTAEMCIILIDFSVLYGLVTYINSSWNDKFNYGKYVDGCINVVFWIALLVFTVITALDEGKKTRMICCLLGIALASGSLLLVSPIGPRCFFADYVLMVWYCAECISEIEMREEIKGLAFKGSVFFAMYILCVNFAIYGTLYKQDRLQLEIIRQAEQSGNTEVTIPILKYEDYLHCARLSGIWAERYKLFYGLSSDMNINY